MDIPDAKDDRTATCASQELFCAVGVLKGDPASTEHGSRAGFKPPLELDPRGWVGSVKLKRHKKGEIHKSSQPVCLSTRVQFSWFLLDGGIYGISA
jgi:hypothetical protein